MPTARLTTKGQVTIPIGVRASLGVDAGDRVKFVEVAPGRYEFITATRAVTALKGMFGKPRKAVSIDDTNVISRYIMQDDFKQSPLAARTVESITAESPGFLPLVAIVELAWVLSSAYELNRSQMTEAFEALLRTKELVVERGETVCKGLRLL